MKSTTQKERAVLQAKIDALPKGNITHKTISGRKYPYLQWQENGKQRGRRVLADELETLQAGIKERKRLQALLKAALQATTADDMQLTAFSRIGKTCGLLSSQSFPSVNETVLLSSMIISTTSAPIKCSFSMVCAVPAKPP